MHHWSLFSVDSLDPEVSSLLYQKLLTGCAVLSVTYSEQQVSQSWMETSEIVSQTASCSL